LLALSTSDHIEMLRLWFFLFVSQCPVLTSVKQLSAPSSSDVAALGPAGLSEPGEEDLLAEVDNEEDHSMEVDVLGADGGLMYTNVKGSGSAARSRSTREVVHMMYIEVADGAGVYKGHYDLLLPETGATISVPQDGRCFWHCIAARSGETTEWLVRRTPTGLAATPSGFPDVDRQQREVEAARHAMEAVTSALDLTDDRELAHGSLQAISWSRTSTCK
jgi:hypothetical protein